MNKNILDDIIYSLGDMYSEIQNKMMQQSRIQLLKGIKSPNDWASYQYLALDHFKERMINIMKLYTQSLNKAWEKALTLSLADATNAKVDVDRKEKKIELKKIDRVYELMPIIQMQNAMQMQVLTNEVMAIHRKAIGQISYDYALNGKEDMVKAYRVPKNRTDRLFNSIKDTVDKYGSVENVPKVNYKTKTDISKQVSWKSYTEMNVRTTLNQESGDYQLKSGEELHIVFYLCSQHADCAKDHIDYQGKIYFDEHWQTFGFSEDVNNQIQDYISSNNLMSIQSVRDGDPYLTTRPNCRHYFEPVPMFDLIDGKTNPQKALKDLKMDKGKGDSDLYDKLQEQRYNERMIRRWKEKKDNQQMLVDKSPIQLKAQENATLEKYTHKVSEWQQKNRELIKDNPYLERQYDRESYKTIVENLGYKVVTK